VKPAAFEYCAPRALDEALDLLARHGAEARVLAGGQSLVPLMNMRLARPAVVIDVNRVPGLDDVREVDGVPIAHRIEMENLVAQSGTVLTLGELRINLGLPLELFSEDSLGAAEN